MATTEVRERLTKTGEGVRHEMEAEGKSVGINLDMDQLIALIREMKKPDDETLEKKAKDEARRQEQMRNMIAVAKLDEANRLNFQARCQHEKQDKSSTWYGQVHSDGKIHPICVRCQKLATPYAPPQELISGMGIG